MSTGPSWVKLVFDDEFNGTSLNSKYWASTWWNGGVMNNVVTDPANVRVTGGHLVLTLASPTSGALVTTDPAQVPHGGFQFGAGYSAEARIFFPGNGSTVYNWPAFWTGCTNWPQDGEADIAEALGTMTSNYHSSRGADNSGTIPGTWANGWHTYGMDRQKGRNRIFWDGKLVRSYPTYDNGAPQFLIFNVGARARDIVTGTASEVLVDWVRVWQNNEE